MWAPDPTDLWSSLLSTLLRWLTVTICGLSGLVALATHFFFRSETIWYPLLVALCILSSISGFIFYKFFIGKPFSVRHFFFISFLRLILRRPMLLSQLRINALNMLIGQYTSQLDDISLEGQKGFENMLISLKKTALSYPEASLSGEDRTSHSVLLWYLDILLEGFTQFKVYAYPLFFFSIYPINQVP